MSGEEKIFVVYVLDEDIFQIKINRDDAETEVTSSVTGTALIYLLRIASFLLFLYKHSLVPLFPCSFFLNMCLLMRLQLPIQFFSIAHVSILIQTIVVDDGVRLCV